jgi:hypothetical protein
VTRQTLFLGVTALGVSLRRFQRDANGRPKQMPGFGSEPSAITPPTQPLEYQSEARRLTTVGTPPLHHFPWLLGISKIPSRRKVRLVFFKNLFLKSSRVWVDFANDLNYPVACSKTNE